MRRTLLNRISAIQQRARLRRQLYAKTNASHLQRRIAMGNGYSSNSSSDYDNNRHIIGDTGGAEDGSFAPLSPRRINRLTPQQRTLLRHFVRMHDECPSSPKNQQRQTVRRVRPDTVDKSQQNNDLFMITASECGYDTLGKRRNIVDVIGRRERGDKFGALHIPENNGFSNRVQCALGCDHLLPNTHAASVQPNTGGRSKVFCTKFINDGELLLTASQDHIIRIYKRMEFDTNEDWGTITRRLYGYMQVKQFTCPDVGWAIIDVAVSGDSKSLIYGTWSNNVYELDLNNTTHEGNWRSYELTPEYERICIFSLRFSDDDRHILCGCKDYTLRIVDRERGEVITTVEDAHEDDINAVVFGSTRSTIFFSAGDDGVIKAWDTRTTSVNASPVGVFAGHRDGITCLDSRGDDRYVVSNSKDQTIKLWDVRMFASEKAIKKTREAVSNAYWDYRMERPPRQYFQQASNDNNTRKDNDCSVLTMRGEHRVQHTLIRAYFSPTHTTGQRFVYTGCSKGKAVVYDILSDGAFVAAYDMHKGPCREVAWHPYRPEIVSASWDGYAHSFCYQEQGPNSKFLDLSRVSLPGSDVETIEGIGLNSEECEELKKRRHFL